MASCYRVKTSCPTQTAAVWLSGIGRIRLKSGTLNQGFSVSLQRPVISTMTLFDSCLGNLDKAVNLFCVFYLAR